MIRQLVFGVGHGMISILGLSIGVVSATGSARIVAITGLVGMLTGLATLVVLEFLSAKTQKQIYDHMVEQEKAEYGEDPEIEKKEMREYYVDEGFSTQEADLFVKRLSLNNDRWLRAHVIHILEFIPSKTGSPSKESAILGLSHVLGAILVLTPYLLLANLSSATYASIIIASLTLSAVGGFKTLITGGRWYLSAFEFLVIGMVAVVAGYLIGFAVKGVL